MNRWLLALCLSACALQARAGTPASEAQSIAAATQAVAFGQAHGMPITLAIAQGNGRPATRPSACKAAMAGAP